MQHFYSFVSQVCHWWCPPFSAGHAAFLFMCLPGLSLLVSALFGWRCNISIHLSPRSVTGGVRPFPLAMQHFYSFVSQVCHWCCPPFSVGHVALLFICFPGLSLVLSALFRWPCSISIHLSPRSVTGGVRPFPLAMQHFYSFVSQVCPCWCPPFSAHFYSFVSQVLFRWPCLLLSSFLSPFLLIIVYACPFCYLLSPFLSPFLLVIVSALSSFLSSFLSPFVSGLVSLLVDHCVRLVSLLFPFVALGLLQASPMACLLFPFLSVIVSVLSLFFPRVCLLVFLHCVRIVSLLSPFVSGLVSLLGGHCVCLVSLLFPFGSLLVSLVGHCVRLVFLLIFLSPVFSPFLLVTVSVLSPLFPFVPLLNSLLVGH